MRVLIGNPLYQRESRRGNRTPDLLITSEPLCHLSYVGP